MATLTYLDTHVAAWLYAGKLELIPPPAKTLLAGSDLVISPMVVLELQYLFEIGRTRSPARDVVAALRTEIGLKVCDLPFATVADRALDLTWTRDPFDRLIVSQAALREAPLLSKDGSIHEHYPRAVWG